MTDALLTLADELHETLLAASPFGASMMGIPGYEAEVPDASREGEQAVLDKAEALAGRAAAVAPTTTAEQITAGCIASTVEQLRLSTESAADEYTVTAMPFLGPPVLLAVAARTVMLDGQAASDYITRLRRSGGWIDQLIERLRAGAAAGRLPVAPLLAQAIGWADSVLASSVPEALRAPQPPAGWDGISAWRADVEAAATDVVVPALARWRAVLADELLPTARPETAAGLTHLPGGDGDYARAVRVHTTLDLTPDELHRRGVDEIAELEQRALQLGAKIGLNDLASIQQALRASAGDLDPDTAIAAATDAVRRAESRAAEIFPAPLPPPCVISPMPPAVAESGMAPHYTRPRQDGGRPGTYWFNTLRPTAGAGWDLEAVAFHEAVPGHHLQLSRIQLLTDLPRLQNERSVTVHAEGWGLYAEQLSDEIGLYTDERAQLGAVTASLMRAARLVVDTGLHAMGWSREQAIQRYAQHVPLPIEFLSNEVDRYIIWPGQALAYNTGKREILRMRDEARTKLGDKFDLPAFHSAVLDSGSLPMPVLQQAVDAWVDGFAS